MSEERDERLLARLRVIGWSMVALLLVLPAVAMRFSDEVHWTASDFLFAGLLLVGTGVLVELLVRQSRDAAYRAGAALALAATLLLVWSNAAVGFVGAGANPANILYVALIGIVAASSFAVGLKAQGMVKVMLVTALAQGLITLMAFATDLVGGEERSVIIVVNAVFIGLWSAAALLFKKAAQREGV